MGLILVGFGVGASCWFGVFKMPTPGEFQVPRELIAGLSPAAALDFWRMVQRGITAAHPMDVARFKYLAHQREVAEMGLHIGWLIMAAGGAMSATGIMIEARMLLPAAAEPRRRMPVDTWEDVSMKAAFIRQTGPPDNIIYADLPDPQPAAGQVLVRTAAVAVNPIDTYIRSGAVAMPLTFPLIVGCDLAGTVERVSAEVKRHQKPEDKVWGTNQGLLGRQGTFAELVPVDQPQWLYPLPAGVGRGSRRGHRGAVGSAHLGLVRDCRLAKGETLFINGGSGGVGSMVIQMSKALGARVIATAGSPEGLETCRQLGADLAVNYKSDDVATQVRAFARPESTSIGDGSRRPISITPSACWPSGGGWC